MIFTCNGSEGTNRSNRFSLKCRLHLLAAQYKPEMTKFHIICSGNWHFFKRAANQKQGLFNIVARTGVVWCCKSQMKWPGCVRILTASMEYFTEMPGSQLWGERSFRLLSGEMATRQAGRKEPITNPGEILGPEKTTGGFSVGVLFSHTVARLCPVGYKGAWEKATSCVSLSHFFIWTEEKPGAWQAYSSCP